MMCYWDKTFCPFKECEKFDKCSIALTKEIIKQAGKWWGEGEAPISKYADKPECFKEN